MKQTEQRMVLATDKGKKVKKTKKALPLKVKLIGYFLLFAAVLLLILWLFQIVFLDVFYREIKLRQLEACMNSISDSIGEDNAEELVYEIRERNDMAVGVYDVSSQFIVEKYTPEDREQLYMTFMPEEVYAYYNLALENGGEIITDSQAVTKAPPQGGGNFFGDRDIRFDRDSQEAFVAAKLVEYGDGEYLILIKSRITPVTSTVETLRIQLTIITAIFVLFAVAVAIYAASRISKPLVKTNEGAKELARQNYAVTFEGDGCREICELSDTLNFAAKELSTVDNLRRELIANISHDLRTPLTMIEGYAEVMRDIPGENTPENLQVVIDETQRLSQLVTDLMDLSKLESGTEPLKKERFCLTDSIRSVFERYTKLVSQENIKLDFEYDRDVYVEADEIRLSQVIYNLINNAINYSDENKAVTVRQTCTDGKVKLEFIDRGKGIDSETLRNIWDRYYRAKEHRSAVVGSGLGLSIVKNVLELHKARFGVVSRVGVGSNFWFEIDALPENTAAEDDSVSIKG